MADHDRRPQHGDRHRTLGQQVLDLAPGPQVGGQVLILPAETAEVDDPLQTGLLGGGAERPRGLGILAFEVVIVQRVHQVVGRVDAAER